MAKIYVLNFNCKGLRIGPRTSFGSLAKYILRSMRYQNNPNLVQFSTGPLYAIIQEAGTIKVLVLILTNAIVRVLNF